MHGSETATLDLIIRQLRMETCNICVRSCFAAESPTLLLMLMTLLDLYTEPNL